MEQFGQIKEDNKNIHEKLDRNNEELNEKLDEKIDRMKGEIREDIEPRNNKINTDQCKIWHSFKNLTMETKLFTKTNPITVITIKLKNSLTTKTN